MNAPLPHFTSSTREPSPAASFLLRMLPVISGIEGTVPVTSRSAYRRRSAGASSRVAPVMQHPTPSTTRRSWPRSSSQENPSIDSSLSSVPPVAPSPRPEIIGTCSPQAAKAGASGIETLSPTPPVECLSPTRCGSGHCKTWPLSRIARVSSTVSSKERSRKRTAIAHAAIWYSGTSPRAYSSISAAISPLAGGLPSRFRAIRSATFKPDFLARAVGVANARWPVERFGSP